jgi:hypothetical protein
MTTTTTTTTTVEVTTTDKSNFEMYLEWLRAQHQAKMVQQEIDRVWDCSASEEQKIAWVQTVLDAEEKAAKIVRQIAGLTW